MAKHGGPRKAGPGARMGQPLKRGVKKVTLSLRVTPAVKAYLASSGNASEALEDIIRRQRDFNAFTMAWAEKIRKQQ